MTTDKRCASCVFGREGPPLDCLMAPPDTRRRSLLVISRRWSEDCAEFTPGPTVVDALWARAVARVFPESPWARNVLDRIDMSKASDGDEVPGIMERSIAERRARSS